jgi:hypothetical protein
MTIHHIHDLANNKIINILKSEFATITNNDIIENYHPDHSDKTGNVFYLLKNGRYKQGCYTVLEEDGKFIASAGWNEYNNNTALLLSRSYVNQQYRTQYLLAQHILPSQISDTQNYINRWITVNDYNSAIYNWFVRSQQGRRTALFDNWPPIYKKFHPIGEKNIYFTPQWVAEYRA